jgi:hypothetical protein
MPVPRGSFALGAPPIFSRLKKTGELYGNRIPGSQPPFGRQWPPGSPGSAYGSDTEGGSPGLRSISMPPRTNSLTGSDDGTTAGERTAVEDRNVDSSRGPVARIEVVPPTPGFPPPEISRPISVDASVPQSIMEESTGPLPKGGSAPVPEIPKTPPPPGSDLMLDSHLTRSPSIHSHVSSQLASVEEEPVDGALERASPSPEQPALTHTPEQIPESITPNATSPKKKKARPPPSPKATLSPPLTSPPLRPLQRSSSVRGRDRNVSISSASGENGSVFTAPPVQGEDVSGGIHLSSTMETVEQDGLGLDLHADENGGSSEEELFRRDEVPQDVEVTGDVVESSIEEPLEIDVKGLSEKLKRDDASIIEDPAFKEPDDQSQGHERSVSSSTTDYTMADSPNSATSQDSEHPERIAPPQLADNSTADIGKLGETMHPEDLPIPDGLQTAAQELSTKQSTSRTYSVGAESTRRDAIEATIVPELSQPVQDRDEDSSQGATTSRLDTQDKQDAISPISPESANSSFSLPYKDSISRAGLTNTGTASPARVLRELKQLGMEKRSSIVLGPTRRASVLSVVLPTSPENLVSFFVKPVGCGSIYFAEVRRTITRASCRISIDLDFCGAKTNGHSYLRQDPKTGRRFAVRRPVARLIRCDTFARLANPS